MHIEKLHLTSSFPESESLFPPNVCAWSCHASLTRPRSLSPRPCQAEVQTKTFQPVPFGPHCCTHNSTLVGFKAKAFFWVGVTILGFPPRWGSRLSWAKVTLLPAGNCPSPFAKWPFWLFEGCGLKKKMLYPGQETTKRQHGLFLSLTEQVQRPVSREHMGWCL